MANMPENVPVADKSGSTNVRIVNTTYIWTIGNFSYCTKDTGEYLYSPKFTSSDDDGIKWRINLYPNGDRDPDSVGLYLYLASCYQNEIMVQTRFSILNHKGEVAYSDGWSPKNIYSYQSSWGCTDFIARSKLFKEADNLLPNDKLTLYCEISAGVGYENRVITNNTGPYPTVNHELQACCDFEWLWKTGYNSDITLIVNGKSFLAHKNILSARSSVFRNMFEEHARKENHLHIVEITDIETPVMEEVLRYIYGGEAKNLNLLGKKILAAAVKYNLSGLKNLCEGNFIKCLNANNAAELLAMADCYKAETLKTETMKFIIKNAKDVIKAPGYESIKNSYPHLFAEAFAQASKNNSNSSKKNKRKNNRKKNYHYNNYYDSYYEDDDYDDEYYDEYSDDSYDGDSYDDDSYDDDY